MVKVSFNRYVSRRVEKIRREVEDETQKLRERTIKNLEEIFRAASHVARGEVEHQRIDGRMVKVSLNKRRRWLQVATHTAKTMDKIATNLDEKEIKAQLNELGRLVNEASTRNEDGKSQKRNGKSGSPFQSAQF